MRLTRLIVKVARKIPMTSFPPVRKCDTIEKEREGGGGRGREGEGEGERKGGREGERKRELFHQK